MIESKSCFSDGGQYSLVCGCHRHNGFLTRRGYEALAEADSSPYLDKVGSVSALAEAEDFVWPSDHFLDEQHRRFLNAVSFEEQEVAC